MEQSEAAGPTRAIAQRVQELRTRRGLTAEQLADRMAEQGVNWQRSTVAKLETGRRENVTVVEWLALSAALDVAPVHLLVPLDSEAPYLVTPSQEVSPAEVRAWVRGFGILPGADPRGFWSEVPEVEFGATEDDGRRYEWVQSMIRYLSRSAGRLYRRDDGTGVFEIELPKAGEKTMPERGRAARITREQAREGDPDAGR